MSNRLLIYGANGYTGELIARQAAALGMNPILAGRSPAVSALATELGCEARVFKLDDVAVAATQLAGVAVVLHCAGPFSATAEPMMLACQAARAHYLDITGEIDVFELGFSLDSRARAAGIVICPGVGFDVVPTDCVALTLKQALPDATALALGFDSRSAMSRGTASTSIEGLGKGSRVRQDGELKYIGLGSRSRRIDFGAGEKMATAIPWGDVSTAYRTTGIPNIEAYVPVSPRGIRNLQRLDRFGWLVGSRPVQALMKWQIRRGKAGPDAKERDRTPVYVWGEVRNAAGRTVNARVKVPNGYTVTTDAAIAIAKRLLQGGATPGFTTPARLMGADFVSTLPGASAIVVD